MFSIVAGIVLTFVWASGLIIFARVMVPYAIGLAALIFIVTSILSTKCGYIEDDREPCQTFSLVCMSIRRYSATVLLSAAIVLLLSLVFVATYLPFVARAIITFLTTASFLTMLLTFIVMIFSMKAKKN